MKNLKAVLLTFLICLLELTFYSCTYNKIEKSTQKEHIIDETNDELESVNLYQSLSSQSNTNNSLNDSNIENQNVEEEDSKLIWYSKDSLIKLVYYKYTPKCADFPYIFYYKGKKVLTLNGNNFFKQIGNQVEPYCLPYINYPPERIAEGVYAIIGESKGSEGYFFRNIWIFKCTKNKGEIKSALVINQPGNCHALNLKSDTLHNKIIVQARMKKGFKYSDPLQEKYKTQKEDYVEKYYSCRINGKEATGRIIPKKDSFNYYYENKQDYWNWRICEVWELELLY